MTKTEKFIDKAIEVHKNIYDYSVTIYQRSDEKVQIICKQHGVFQQRASMHLSGQGCKKCAVEKRSLLHNSTTKEFIKKAIDIHSNRYDYSNVNYINTKIKIAIICKQHGSFLQRPDIHLSGSGCTKCANELKEGVPPKTQQDFIEKAIKIHKGKYSYEKSIYTKSRENVIITCCIHGDFLQTASAHTSGKGCSKCSDVHTARINTNSTEQFVEKSKKIHGDIYDYSLTEYKKSYKKVTICCKTHGEFAQTPNSHLAGSGCNKCGYEASSLSCRATTKDFVDKSKIIHSEFYTYLKTNYVNSQVKVTITCPVHGDFEQIPNGHSLGFGCNKCANSKKGGYGRSSYIKKANGKICTLYILRCFSESEDFYKIGITVKTIKKRYSTREKMPYNYEIISEAYGEASFIWDLESEQKRKLKVFNYQPKIEFGGSKTECFTQYTTDEAN